MHRRKKICIVLCITVAVITLLALFQKPIILSYYKYVHTWHRCADFKAYRNEFVLVKDYVATYMGDTNGVLAVSYTGEHRFDLFDYTKSSYLNCPEEIKSAIGVLCKEAFPDQDTSLDHIRKTGDEISFETESGPYKLSYCPHKLPVMTGYTEEETKIRRLGDGWYHVVGQRE